MALPATDMTMGHKPRCGKRSPPDRPFVTFCSLLPNHDGEHVAREDGGGILSRWHDGEACKHTYSKPGKTYHCFMAGPHTEHIGGPKVGDPNERVVWKAEMSPNPAQQEVADATADRVLAILLQRPTYAPTIDASLKQIDQHSDGQPDRTVQGRTTARIDRALSMRGERLPVWGPRSGDMVIATIGIAAVTVDLNGCIRTFPSNRSATQIGSDIDAMLAECFPKKNPTSTRDIMPCRRCGTEGMWGHDETQPWMTPGRCPQCEAKPWPEDRKPEPAHSIAFTSVIARSR